MLKRISASLFHHSTISFLKRNRCVSAWFLKKTSEEQVRQLNLSEKKAPEARKQSAEAERDAVAKRKVISEEQRQKKLADAEKKRQNIVTIMDRLQPHHGPCTTPENVDAVLAAYGSRTNQKTAVQTELKYRKHVLGLKSSLLRITGSLLQLIKNLLLFPGRSEVEARTFQLPPTSRHRRPGQAAPRVMDSDSDSDMDFEEQNDESPVESESEMEIEPEDNGDVDFVQDFKFQHEGQMAAFYFHEDFYIGEVVRVLSEDTGEVSFMEKARQVVEGQEVFR